MKLWLLRFGCALLLLSSCQFGDRPAETPAPVATALRPVATVAAPLNQPTSPVGRSQVVPTPDPNAPERLGLPEDQTLYLDGGESSNPRAYDPATGGGDLLVFNGLVGFDQNLGVIPDLAERWEIDASGRVYTFTLRENARFHNGRAVTAQDVIYSWERAADPQTASDTVLTYLGDIEGVQARRAGQASSIRGLQALDQRRVQVTLDAPKPYFPMKLTYRTAYIVDRANLESGPNWYEQPNGAGPYQLIRWDRGQLQVYERHQWYHLESPAIRYIAVQIYQGSGLRLYEQGLIDITGISVSDLARTRDPQDPLYGSVLEGVGLCTTYVVFDTTRPPFDDPAVRRAFALAINREQYVQIATDGQGLTARGLYPPGLPGWNQQLQPQVYDPAVAQQALATSRYAGPQGLPPLVFTSSGFGSDTGRSVTALLSMWQQVLGVTITVQNLEPNHWLDEVYQGRHGHLMLFGWCADYPDPENFADALFHSSAQQNIGKYQNQQFDRLVEQARVEPNVSQRMRLYQQAEQLLVDDSAAIFLSHSRQFLLVKPYVQNYRLVPIAIPNERFLALAPRP